jgi:hypothetical protein
MRGTRSRKCKPGWPSRRSPSTRHEASMHAALRTYRIVTRDGVELARLQAASLAEVIATHAASVAPLEARIVSADGSKVLARRELWTGTSPGWSVMKP